MFAMQAQNDNSQGYHATFGACQERGQCECNGYSSLQQCMQVCGNPRLL